MLVKDAGELASAVRIPLRFSNEVDINRGFMGRFALGGFEVDATIRIREYKSDSPMRKIARKILGNPWDDATLRYWDTLHPEQNRYFLADLAKDAVRVIVRRDEDSRFVVRAPNESDVVILNQLAAYLTYSLDEYDD